MRRFYFNNYYVTAYLRLKLNYLLATEVEGKIFLLDGVTYNDNAVKIFIKHFVFARRN